ncbi:MAG: response regulator [Gemmatimonadales bacterium]|nr:response regulator [Gemmatimonadales bacterium]
MSDTDGTLNLLVVDDEESIRSALNRFLSQQGYHVVTAESGEEALDILAREPIDAALLDVRLPGISGIDLVPKVVEAGPNIAILMLTAVNDATTASLCMQRGAMEYLTKPIDLKDLDRAIRRALDRRESSRQSSELSEFFREEGARRIAELERVSVATLEVLVNALEAKDSYSRGHSARVADLSAMVAAELGLADEEVERVRTAGRLHDIGKIGVREDIFLKQGPLTKQEYEMVKQHVVIGSQILAPLAHLQDIADSVLHHHERWDGGGYPDRIRGDEIPLGARIIGAVEIFDALTTSRPYQEKMSAEFAIERMRDLMDTAVEPRIYLALEAVVGRRRTLVFLEDDGRN